MKVLDIQEVQEVSGGLIWFVVGAVALAGAGYAGKKSIDSAQLAANGKIAKEVCGEGKVKHVDANGYSCYE